MKKIAVGLLVSVIVSVALRYVTSNLFIVGYFSCAGFYEGMTIYKNRREITNIWNKVWSNIKSYIHNK
jgi:hypothetical protein